MENIKENMNINHCKFTKQVNCNQHNECDCCGWNPKVTAKRIRGFRNKRIKLMGRMIEVNSINV